MIVIKFVRYLVLLLPVIAQDYNYDDPTQWVVDFPKCGGERQSPIDLSEETAYHVKIPPLKFLNYNIPLNRLEAVNDGHSISINVPRTAQGKKPAISGGGLKSVYEVENFHFHWGATEHTIDDIALDMEMHVVHKNINYPTFSEATENADGIVVLGLLFEGSRKATKSGLNVIYNTLQNLTEYRSRQVLNTPITMYSILGNIKNRSFFKYEGSLTTPDCSEAVTWFVFMDSFRIKHEYLERFWDIEDPEGQLLDNYRPIQDTNNRRVYFSKGGWCGDDH